MREPSQSIEETTLAGQRPITKTLGIAEASNRLAGLICKVQSGNTRIIIEDAGAPVAVLVTPDDARRLALLDEKYSERRRVLAAMRAPFQHIPDDEIEREVAAAAEEVRAEMRAERGYLVSRR